MHQRRVVGVEATAASGREIIPGHVRGADVDASIADDVLRGIDAGVAGVLAIAAAGAVPAGNNKLIDFQLAGGHVLVGAAAVGHHLEGA